MRPEITLDCPVETLDLIFFVEKCKPLDDFRAFHAVDVHEEPRHHAEHLLLDKRGLVSGQVGDIQLLAPREKLTLDMVFVGAGFIKNGKPIHPGEYLLFDI